LQSQSQSQSQSQTSLNGSANPNPTTSLQSHHDSTTPPHLTALDSLPTITGTNNQIILANDSIPEFLAQELDLSRLNRIHGYLWMAGRPMRARPLHRYKMLSYEILCTQQMDLHLLKFSNKLIVKPLPEWILDHTFWTQHLCSGPKEVHASACGFLLSYIWLVVSPLDLTLAHEYHLLPPFVTWTLWKSFVRDVYGNVAVNTLKGVNPRYHFGDLRLGRINVIYRLRFFSTHFVRGYLYGYNRYVVFFQRNFGWMLVVFVFFSIVLSAMQVGTGLGRLHGDEMFLTASYGFVLFSILIVVVVLGAVGVLFVGVFLYNMGMAIWHAKSEQQKRKVAVEEKVEGDHP
jgi:hypothetical protein